MFEIFIRRSHGITPVFVFNGLNIIRKDKPFSTEDNRPAKRAQAWDLYEKGRVEPAYSSWAVQSGFVNQPDLLYLVFSILKENDVEFIRAPYLAWGQVCGKLFNAFFFEFAVTSFFYASVDLLVKLMSSSYILKNSTS
jgi:hypothetical protein